MAKPIVVSAGLEEGLRDLYSVAGLQFYVLGWVTAKLSDIVDRNVVAA